MNHSLKIYIGLLVVLIFGIMLMDASRPKPIDWSPYYKTHIKKPLGLYVLNQELDQVFKNQKIERILETPYEYLDYYYIYDSIDGSYEIEGTLLSIYQELPFDETSLDEILLFVGKGNQAFISSNNFPKLLADSIGFSTNYRFYSNDTITTVWHQKMPLSSSYQFTKGFNGVYFDSISNSTTQILGSQIVEKDTLANFIAVKYRQGIFYLHTQPAAFSNYHLLKDEQANYATDLLSVVPEQKPIYWLQKNMASNDINQSPMRFILSQPALKSAWYLFLVGMLIFILFRVKRKQRIIDIIEPLPNTTVDFTKTIGNLYFQEGEHGAIIDKKIIYFLEKIRSEFLIETTQLDAEFNKKLHFKSGRDLEMIEKITQLIQENARKINRTEADLLKINEAIETFWQPKKK